MNAAATYTLVLDEEERAKLLGLLEQAVIEKRREEHRTDARAYREEVRHQEEVMERLTAKVRALQG